MVDRGGGEGGGSRLVLRREAVQRPGVKEHEGEKKSGGDEHGGFLITIMEDRTQDTRVEDAPHQNGHVGDGERGRTGPSSSCMTTVRANIRLSPMPQGTRPNPISSQ